MVYMFCTLWLVVSAPWCLYHKTNEQRSTRLLHEKMEAWTASAGHTLSSSRLTAHRSKLKWARFDPFSLSVFCGTWLHYVSLIVRQIYFRCRGGVWKEREDGTDCCILRVRVSSDSNVFFHARLAIGHGEPKGTAAALSVNGCSVPLVEAIRLGLRSHLLIVCTKV